MTMLRGTIQTLNTLVAQGKTRLPLDWVTVWNLSKSTGQLSGSRCSVELQALAGVDGGGRGIELMMGLEENIGAASSGKESRPLA